MPSVLIGHRGSGVMSGCDLLSAGPVQLHSRSSVHTCIRRQDVMELPTVSIKSMSSTVGIVVNTFLQIVHVF